MRSSALLILLSAIIVSCAQMGEKPCGRPAEALDCSLWEKSEWISVPDAPVVTGPVKEKSNCRAADGASWFVRSVANPKPLKEVRWMATGLGVFNLYVNGRPVGAEILKPGFTDPRKTKIAFTYDISDAVQKRAGEQNVFSAQLTPGWWADKIVTPNKHDGMVGRKCAFRCIIELTYEDGSREKIGTDTLSWKAGIAGPVTHAAIFDGEEYDARIPMGYETVTDTPELNQEFAGEIVPTGGAEVYFREDLAMKPVESYVWKDIEGADSTRFGTVVKLRSYSPGRTLRLCPGETLVVDFGQNAAAVPDFVFKAAEGTVLTCLPSEILNDGAGALSRGMDGPEGSCHRQNLRIQDHGLRLDYTFAGKGWEHYRPRCTFFGYRYLSITATGEVSIKGIQSVPVSSITASGETGRIRTGNDEVNRLLANILWGQRSNYLSVPTDCPQRNERLGWTADTQVFAETGSFFADTRSFFHKWMRDVRDAQGATGGIPGVAPVAQFGSTTGHMMRLGWSDAGVIVPWIVWKQFGDTAIVDENWEMMRRFVAHVDETRHDHKATLDENGDFQWADWLSYEPLESYSKIGLTPKDAAGKRHPLPETLDYWNYLGACYWLLDASMMRDMAAATGRDAAEYDAMVSRAREYILDRFLREDGSFRTEILNTMQTPALFALRCGLLEGQAREAAIRRLRDNFAAHEGCLQTGFLGTSILMQTLTDNGMADIAWELLLQHRNPSWLYSVDNGATTIWERWNSYTTQDGMGPKGMNSFNHYAYGCVGEWIWETAAGIAADSADPGFHHIIMKPVPDRRLGSLQAEYNSAAGLIKSAWHYEGESWIWDFCIPDGATASVTLPGETLTTQYGPGTYHIEQGPRFCITDFGAIADSTILQTEAIQRTIDEAAAHGGTVVIPAGVWLSGALFFGPGTQLYLDEGAVLKGSTDTWDFPDVPVHIEGVLQPYAAALINADGCDGFSIRGLGTLDGNGAPYWDAFWARRKENPQCTNLEVRRPRMVSVSHSRDIRIEGVKLRNSAFWNIHLYKCRGIEICGVDIYAPIKPVKAPSSDGIDLDACSDVHIAGCSIATGDDLIALKGGKGPRADKSRDNGTNSNILIEDCKFGHGPGVLVFGSECIGAKHVTMRNCRVTKNDRLLWLKMRPDTPQHFSDIVIEGVKGDVRNIVYAKPWTQFFDLGGAKKIPMSYADGIEIRGCKLKCRHRRNITEAPDQYEITGLRFSANKLNWIYNRDESKVKPYTLPDPLVFADSSAVSNPEDWQRRRQEILELFQTEMYGQMPPAGEIYLETTEEPTPQEDYALRKRVRMTFRPDGSGPHMDWLILYPAATEGPCPAVLSLNYYGNDSTYTQKRFPVPMKEIAGRGYAYVTACYEDVSPDPEDIEEPEEQRTAARAGVYELWDPSCTTGSIMAWAWALCRGMDMLQQDPAIDPSRVVLTGSSRLAKAAMLSAAFDERFPVVVLNQTGGGGVPLSKRNFGEFVSSEVEHYGYWWCREFAKWASKEASMPFDQHMLLACIAPRRLLVEGFNNPWFDTYGEFLSLKAASPVWRFLGAEGLPEVDFPANDDTSAIGSTLGYVRRDGQHGIDDADWGWLMDFAGF